MGLPQHSRQNFSQAHLSQDLYEKVMLIITF